MSALRHHKSFTKTMFKKVCLSVFLTVLSCLLFSPSLSKNSESTSLRFNVKKGDKFKFNQSFLGKIEMNVMVPMSFRLSSSSAPSLHIESCDGDSVSLLQPSCVAEFRLKSSGLMKLDTSAKITIEDKRFAVSVYGDVLMDSTSHLMSVGMPSNLGASISSEEMYIITNLVPILPLQPITIGTSWSDTVSFESQEPLNKLTLIRNHTFKGLIDTAGFDCAIIESKSSTYEVQRNLEMQGFDIPLKGEGTYKSRLLLELSNGVMYKKNDSLILDAFVQLMGEQAPVAIDFVSTTLRK